MNIEKLEELRSQLVAMTKQKQKAMENMDAADSMRMQAEADYGVASEAIYSIKNKIIAHMIGE